MSKNNKVTEKDSAVIKFAGDSGDGMQLTGTLFSETAAMFGNDLATFPDFPAEIRAPHNTVFGVSGFQAQIGQKKINSSGDFCDVLVAMNPASLKANLKWVKKNGTIIVDADAFDKKALEKSGYDENPLENNTLKEYKVVKAPITTITKESLSDLELPQKVALRSKNMVALGIAGYLFNQDINSTYRFIEKKFKGKDQVIESNKKALAAGYEFAKYSEEIDTTYFIPKAELSKGKYRNVTGNAATAWGFIAAAERSGHKLFLGSYPITPATEILIEMALQKSLGGRVFQAEDEIAGVCSAIGASYTGSLAVTTTSGPGFSLKSEAIGLAVITELPLVIVNVQRGGPSTGLPTKSEQSDLLQALYGRNGECPLIVISASTPANCFNYAYEAAKLSMEHMTPVVLLTEGYLGFGSELFRIPDTGNLPDINPPVAEPNDPEYKPYARDKVTLARKWALPGTEGLRHRVGGLEKFNIGGQPTTDPLNHELMTKLREDKVNRVVDYIPEQSVNGEETGDLLVVGWGSTYGAINEAVTEMQKEGKKVSHAHFHHIKPLPKNTKEILGNFKKIIVCEINAGQMVKYLKIEHPEFKYHQYNKIQGLPFTVQELTETFNKILEEK